MTNLVPVPTFHGHLHVPLNQENVITTWNVQETSSAATTDVERFACPQVIVYHLLVRVLGNDVFRHLTDKKSMRKTLHRQPTVTSHWHSGCYKQLCFHLLEIFQRMTPSRPVELGNSGNNFPFITFLSTKYSPE